MNWQRWKTIEALYLGALEASDRNAFLEEACAHDSDLRTEVEALLDDESATLGLFRPIDSEPLAPGSTFGAYHIVELLGSGGSADVYKAFDPRLDRDVALKVFTTAALADDFQSRFEREAKAAAALNHPNIATIYEVGRTGEYWFIAMEHIDGITFRETLDDDVACPVEERLRYLTHVARALARAHAQGIVHCDLKPENVMIARDGLVKVLDFGLARLVQPQRTSRTATPAALGPGDARRARIEGTIGYMSPEQASGKEVGAAADVFAFGCMLFEAVANRLPFWSPSVVRSIHSLQHEAAPRVDAFTRKAPAGLQRLIDDCLAKDPAARFPSMEDVGRRLDAIVERKPRVATWAVAAAVALVSAAVLYVQWPAPVAPASVAVVPFVSMPPSPDGEMIAQQISEGLNSTLTQLSDLKVTAPASSFRFSVGRSDVREIAKTLGVRTIVTGRVNATGGSLRLAAELIDGTDGTTLWGKEYTPQLSELGDVQTQIAAEVARRVRADVTPDDLRRMARTVHQNPDVNALVLRGRYQMSLYSPDSTQKAASFFEQALGIDPNYAVANAELANVYRRLATAGLLEPPTALREAERAALTAIGVDMDLAEAHTALADIRRDQWQWDVSLREYQRAIKISPSYVPAHEGLAIAYSVLGQDDAAVAELTKIRDLDPVGLSGAVDAAAVFYNVRRFDQALETLRNALGRDRNAPALWTWTGIVSGGKGDMHAAVDAFTKARQFGDNTLSTLCYYIHVLARTGRSVEATRLLETLEGSGDFVPPSALAIAHVGLGDNEGAIQLLQQGFAAKDPLLQYIVVEPFLWPVTSDPRFQAMVKGMRLPPPKPH